MIQIKNVLYRVNPLVAAVTLILAALIPVIASTRANALALTNRSLMVSSTVPNDDLDAPDGTTYTVGTDPEDLDPGDPRNGQRVSHTYTFTPSTDANVGGFTIEYCETAFEYLEADDAECAATSLVDSGDGFSAAAWDGGSVTIGGQSFTVSAEDPDENVVDNFLTLTSGTPIDLDPGVPVTITFDATDTNYFENPNADYLTATNGGVPINGTYFAHITTFATGANATASYGADSATGMIDDGTVTNNVTQSISIYTRVQETLNFSVEGETPDDGVAGPTSDFTDPDTDPCAPLTAASLLYIGDTNNALEVGQAHTGKSYFRLATNASNGTTVYYSGDTLRSGGGHAITTMGTGGPPLTTAAGSLPGTEQFGMAFDLADAELNASINVVGDDGELTPEDPYLDASSGYAFDATSLATPRPLATADGVVQCDTGGLQYIANISADTPAGIYTTKINYIAAPTY